MDRTPTGDFGWALDVMWRGDRVRRVNWDDAGKNYRLIDGLLYVNFRDETQAVLEITDAQELLATDWTLYVEPEVEMTFEQWLRSEVGDDISTKMVAVIDHDDCVGIGPDAHLGQKWRIAGNTAERVKP